MSKQSMRLKLTDADKIPASIVQAICKVQSQVACTPKGEKNEFSNYKFVSTDQIYAALTNKLATAGLVIMTLESFEPQLERIVSVDRAGKPVTQQWARMGFEFILATESDTWQDPRSRRCLFVQVTGPQTFMAAQSYASKTYLRSLFLMPTGDAEIELDHTPQAEDEAEQVQLSRPVKKSARQSKKDGTADKLNEMTVKIRGSTCKEDLQEKRSKIPTVCKDWPDKWRNLLLDEIEDRYLELSDLENKDKEEAALAEKEADMHRNIGQPL